MPELVIDWVINNGKPLVQCFRLPSPTSPAGAGRLLQPAKDVSAEQWRHSGPLIFELCEFKFWVFLQFYLCAP